jgi:predicted hydrocarbon binding protein
VSVRVPLRDDGGGGLWVGGHRYLLVRPETVVAVQRAVEAALGPAAADCLAAGGRAGGARALASVGGSPRERVERLLATGTAIGWGHFQLERFGPRELVVEVRHSPFAEAYGPAPGPVCHLTRGVLDALAAAVLEQPVRVVELACAAAGAPACRFSATPAREGAP